MLLVMLLLPPGRKGGWICSGGNGKRTRVIARLRCVRQADLDVNRLRPPLRHEWDPICTIGYLKQGVGVPTGGAGVASPDGITTTGVLRVALALVAGGGPTVGFLRNRPHFPAALVHGRESWTGCAWAVQSAATAENNASADPTSMIV